MRIALKPSHPAVVDRHLERAAHRAHPAHAVNGPPARGVDSLHVRRHQRTHFHLVPGNSPVNGIAAYETNLTRPGDT